MWINARYWPWVSVKRGLREGIDIGALLVIKGSAKERATVNVRYRITLSSEERAQLHLLVQGGQGPVRRVKRAQILLAAASGSRDERIAANVSVGTATVCRTKRRFVEEGLESALSEDPRPGAERKLAAKEEALLVATACSKPPAGRARWTLSLLADEMVRLTPHRSLPPPRLVAVWRRKS